jgi:hypothetical protein
MYQVVRVGFYCGREAASAALAGQTFILGARD